MSLSATTCGAAYEQRTSSATSDARHESPVRFPVADVRGFVDANRDAATLQVAPQSVGTSSGSPRVRLSHNAVGENALGR
jgi:hypothetical protein